MSDDKQIVGGGFTVSGDDLIDAVAKALGIELRATRSTGDADYYAGHALGLRFTLTVTGHGAESVCDLAYLAEGPGYVAAAELVSIDFHLERLLAAAGLTTTARK